MVAVLGDLRFEEDEFAYLAPTSKIECPLRIASRFGFSNGASRVEWMAGDVKRGERPCWICKREVMRHPA